MELWIRSQDKEILFKVNNLSLVFNNKDKTCEIINSFEDHQCWELGTYKTKERALEVLDEIQKLLMPQIITSYESKLEIHPEYTVQNIVRNIPKTEIQELSTYVYEMPKE